MTDRIYNVLILCTGNSARSILAEAILNHKGKGRVRAFSAGSFPTGTVNPGAIDLLRSLKIPTEGYRSKSWVEFAAPGAPPLDFIITVCDNAAGEVCPIWPGKPITAHWGVPDPAHVEGASERVAAFREAYRVLERRIDLLLQLPLDTLDRASITQQLRDIGKVS